jgi:hypothetical protein
MKEMTQLESLGKAKFTSAEGRTTDKESAKQAYQVGSPLRFYL